MNTHCSFPLTARFRSTDATEESTPPETPHSTLPSILPESSVMVSSRKLLMLQLFLAPQTLKTKLDSIALPFSVWATSGWNWTPNCLPSADWTAA